MPSDGLAAPVKKVVGPKESHVDALVASILTAIVEKNLLIAMTDDVSSTDATLHFHNFRTRFSVRDGS